ncbi:hypothetical protein A4X03_0g8122 [Tilletia caries]|uniref:NAD(P)-binding domain-containing protein n=1 Tax=Tilletia caries TaxID=13290 RepID=A0A8T8SJX3_9BASI|nr:hypothetical protein A4X03_0g8122 [Tilletia caries]
MSQPKAIAIGASRGKYIGQGLLQKLAREGYEAFGTIRSQPKDDHTFQVDLTDLNAASVKAAAANFDSLDLLIAFLPALRKGKQKTIVFITSNLGSIGFNLDNARQPADERVPVPSSPYGATKAALNLIGISLYSELSAEGFSVLLVRPGLVRTDMTNGFLEVLEKASPANSIPALTIDESTDAIVKTVKAHIVSGKPDVKHLNYDGTELSR